MIRGTHPDVVLVDDLAPDGRRLAPVFERVCAQLAEAARQCEAAGLLPPPPPDAREQPLAAKRAPGRTGPPAPRMDGRRAR